MLYTCLFPPLGALGSHTGHQPWQHTPLSAGPSRQPPLLPFQIPDTEHMPFVTAPSYSPGAPVLNSTAPLHKLGRNADFQALSQQLQLKSCTRCHPISRNDFFPLLMPLQPTEDQGTLCRCQGIQMKTRGPWRCTGFPSLYGEHE